MKTKTFEPLLRQHPVFEGMDDETIRLITGCAKNVRFRAGEAVARHGEPANEFFLIREGRLAIDVPAVAAGTLRMQTADEGDVVGWSWLVPPYLWHFDVTAVTEVRAFSMDGKCLRTKCEADAKLGYEFLKRFSHVMVERLEAMRLQLLDVYGVRPFSSPRS